MWLSRREKSSMQTLASIQPYMHTKLYKTKRFCWSLMKHVYVIQSHDPVNTSHVLSLYELVVLSVENLQTNHFFNTPWHKRMIKLVNQMTLIQRQGIAHWYGIVYIMCRESKWNNVLFYNTSMKIDSVQNIMLLPHCLFIFYFNMERC